MDKNTERAYEAHVAFELKQWRGKTLLKQTQAEVSAFWTWAEQTSLAELTDAKRIEALTERRILGQPLSDGLAATIADITKKLISLPVNKKTSAGDVLSDELVMDGVARLANAEQLREATISQIVRSPVFKSLIADNLYQGIRDYVTKENIVTQKMPGVSKLIGVGTGALSKRMPGMGEKLDQGLRHYIDSNVPKLVEQSEQFLQQSLSNERITEVAADLWQVLKESPLSISEYVDQADVDSLAEYSQQVWEELRQSKYVQSLVSQGIKQYFRKQAKRSLNELLADLNLDEAALQTEAASLVPQVVAAMDSQGYLEATLRRRLSAFYSAKSTAKLFAV